MTIPKIPSYDFSLDSNFPAPKVDWAITPNRSALLIHDMQDYFIDFYGEDSDLINKVITKTYELKQWAIENNVPVYYTAQPAHQSSESRGLLNDMWGPGLPARPERSGITPRLSPSNQDVVLTKWRYSAFFNSDLETLLRKSRRDQLLICGIYAHIGVLQTAAEAFMNGIQPFVFSDATADFNAEDHHYAMRYVQRNLGVVASVEQLVKQRELELA